MASSTAISSNGFITHFMASVWMPLPSGVNLSLTSGSVTRLTVTKIFIATPYLKSLIQLERFEKLASDDHTLNLIRAFIDLQKLGVAHQLFNRVIFHIAVSTKYLHG